MQLATKHADIWESSYLSPEEFASMNSEFEKISNPTKRFVKSIELDVIIANSDSELEYKNSYGYYGGCHYYYHHHHRYYRCY